MNRDPLETISITIGGRQITGFTNVSISYSVEETARTASLTISDFGGRNAVFPGDECTLSASGEVILTGYVGDVSPQHDDQNHSVSVALVSRTIDAVEASIVDPSGFVEKKDMIEIAEHFAPPGVEIEATESFPKEPRSFVNSGASLHAHLKPLARAHGAFIYDTPEGKLRIAKKPRGRHAGALAIGTGGNIKSASARISEAGRHDEIIVRGQAARGTGKAALQIEARAKDSGVKRHRPKVIVLEGEATAGKLKERAERYARRSAGFSRQATITVAGWRDQAGRIFEEHFLISVADARIYIDQDMVIKTVSLQQDVNDGGSGTTATLTLVDPPALNGEAGGGAGQWQTSEIAPSVSI